MSGYFSQTPLGGRDIFIFSQLPLVFWDPSKCTADAAHGRDADVGAGQADSLKADCIVIAASMLPKS